MTAPMSTAELLSGDLLRHSPPMAQYPWLTPPANGGEAFEATLVGAVPSWSPRGTPSAGEEGPAAALGKRIFKET